MQSRSYGQGVRRRRRRNPGAFDNAASFLNFAMMAGVAVAGYTVLTKLSDLIPGFKWPWDTGGDDDQNPANHHCVRARPLNGNTHLTLDVSPVQPYRATGTSVRYTGRLLFRSLVMGWMPVTGMRVDFWDAAVCTLFDSTWTDGEGYYDHERLLDSSELNGYDVFAYFEGQNGFLNFGDLGAANTGIWNVRPQ